MKLTPVRRRRALAPVTLLLLMFMIVPSFDAAAVPQFGDGFESGNLANWTTSTGVQVQSAITFAGNFAARATSTGASAYASKQLSTSQPDLYMDARVHKVAVSGMTFLLRFRSATGQKLISVAVTGQSKLRLKNHVTGGLKSSATSLPSGSFQELQLHVFVNGTSSLAEVWLNGTRVNDISGTESLGTSPIRHVEIGTNGSSSGFDVVFDEVLVDTAFIGGGGAPAVPTNLHTTSVSASQVDLAWNASSGATTYRVYRDGPQLGTASSTAFQDATVDPSSQYSYTVDACNSSGCSAQTAPLVVNTPAAGGNPIEHIIVVVLENRTFDNVVGSLCSNAGGTLPCDGATTGTLSNGQTVTLGPEPDIRTQDPNHNHENQVRAMNGGQMDQFDLVLGCGAGTPSCYARMTPGDPNSAQAPNVWNYMQTYASSDMTFEPYTSSSWVAHLEIAAGSRGGWHGNNPRAVPGQPVGPGWGCNSLKDAPWDTSPTTLDQRPSCVPDAADQGPYRLPHAPHVPTIFDRLDAAGKSWKIYVNSINSAWSICATFWSCYNTSQANNVVAREQLATDAANGTLPNFAFVIPKNVESFHPSFSVAQSDTWLGSVVDPLLTTGPEAQRLSTAVFVYWDDCGCIFDHVNPLQFDPNWGPRTPMIAISPWAKPGYVSHTPTTWAGILAFAEHTYGLQPLGEQDTPLYNDATGAMWFADMFDFTQTPITPPSAAAQQLSPEQKQMVAAARATWTGDDNLRGG